ncbi:restriction endonuclease subunit S [Rhodococcus sp. NPDC047139]|uniref:restriction endonuclease subunit S n=1 Tax=Rhodococcus sp. NPDC047139 TaxID=3155141 RepID=UPI0033C72F47
MSRPLVELADIAAPKGIVGGPFGSSLVNKDYAESGVPVIRGANMSLGKFVSGEFVYVTPEKVESDLSRNQARPGDLVFTQRGTLGQVALVPAVPFERYVVSQSQMRVTINPDVADTEYVYYACSSETFLRQISDHAISTGVPHINLGILGRLRVPLPTLREQRAIAEVLGALDDKIAANRRCIQSLNHLADAEYSRFSMETTKCESRPDVITLVELSRMGAIVFGDGYRTKRAELNEDGYRIIRVADIFDGEIHLNGTDFVSYERRKAIGSKAGQPGDIVLTTKGTVGRLAVFEGAEEPVVYSPQVCFFRVRNGNGSIERSYLRRWLSSPSFLSQASYRKGNTDMADYLNLTDIGSMKLDLPPIEDQRVLANTLEPLEESIASLRREARVLADLRSALLPRLMSGEFHVRDAERAVSDVV